MAAIRIEIDVYGLAAAGAVRFSPDRFNTDGDIDRALEAMETIASRRQSR